MAVNLGEFAEVMDKLHFDLFLSTDYADFKHKICVIFSALREFMGLTARET